MANNVSNQITFDAIHADIVFPFLQGPEECVDFNTLVPQPQFESDEFGDKETEWNWANWNTKWNAYECSCTVNDGKAIIRFQTAWSHPVSVIKAFADKFRIPFEHKFLDELGNFWGIENWCEMGGVMVIVHARNDNPDDLNPLCEELIKSQWSEQERQAYAEFMEWRAQHGN